mgnify:CR=1 FL=1
MLSKTAKWNIGKLYALLSVRSFMIVLPILTLYFMDHGLTMQQVFLLQVFFAVLVILIEVPSGYFADVFSRKSSLTIGAIFGFAGFIAYWLADGFSGFLFAEFFLALSVGFLSGADSAILYDTLLAENVEKLYTKYEGRFLSFRTGTEAIAALIGTSLLLIMPFKDLFFCQAIIMFFMIPIALSIKEPEVHVAKEERKSVLQVLKFAIHENPKLRYLNTFGAFLYSSTLVMVWYSQPLWKNIGMPLVYFGIVWAGMNLLVALSSFFAHKLDEHLSFKTLFTWLAFVPIVIYSLLALAVHNSEFIPYYVIVAVTALFWIFRGFYTPIIKDYINKEADSSTRATVLSVQSLFNNLIFSALSPFLGWVADIWSFGTAFYISALVFGIPAIIFFFLLHARMKTY